MKHIFGSDFILGRAEETLNFNFVPLILDRTMKSDGGKLDWVLEKMEELQHKTPAKKDEIPIAEIPDLPEEEEEDDLEYDPALDPDKSRCSDDEESSVANSDIGTPGGPRSAISASSFLSPMAGSRECKVFFIKSWCQGIGKKISREKADHFISTKSTCY